MPRSSLASTAAGARRGLIMRGSALDLGRWLQPACRSFDVERGCAAGRRVPPHAARRDTPTAVTTAGPSSASPPLSVPHIALSPTLCTARLSPFPSAFHLHLAITFLSLSPSVHVPSLFSGSCSVIVVSRLSTWTSFLSPFWPFFLAPSSPLHSFVLPSFIPRPQSSSLHLLPLLSGVSHNGLVCGSVLFCHGYFVVQFDHRLY